MNTAIVTGASSGIGEAISAMLLANGYSVYGIGRNFSECRVMHNADFHALELDLTDTAALCQAVKKLTENEEINLLVNNAGVGYFAPHEELNPQKIHEMTAVNLEAPLVLTNLLLRSLKKNKGTVVNISSVTANKTNTHGCAYGAVKAGLSNFSRSLFEEVRKYGVRVILIQPDMTQSKFYRNADFSASNDPLSALLASDVADAVKTAITLRDGVVLKEITVSPQLHKIEKSSRTADRLP